MNIIMAKDYDEMSRLAAEYIAAVVREKPDAVIGLATGSTPVGTYQELARLHREEGLSFADCSAVNLDEYVGLEADHPQSYAYFMNDNLFNHIDMPASSHHIPNGVASDINAECERYERLITDLGGVDVQVLGIGRNGHIGFNEPNSIFPKNTHYIELTPDSIEANSRFFGPDEVQPTSALTMGFGSIMAAKSVLLLVGDAHKTDILRKSIYGEVDPQVPASALQFHQSLTVITTTKL